MWLFVVLGLAALGGPAFGADEPVVEVLGSRVSSMEDLPAMVHRVTSDDIRRSGARNLQEVLDLLPGVNGLVSGAGMAQSKGISVRGMTTEVLLLVDGVPFMTSSYGTGAVLGAPFDLRTVPLSSIERVEVLKGASSALYGSHGLGGVINVVTRKGAAPAGFSLTGGSDGYLSGTVWASGGDRVTATVRYSREEEGQRRIRRRTNGLYDRSDDYRANHYGLDLKGDGWTFKASLGDYSSRWTYDGDLNRQENDYGRYVLELPVPGDLSLKAYYGSNFKRVFDSSGRSEYQDSNLGLALDGRGKWGSNLLAYGIELRRDSSDYRNFENPFGNNDPYDLKRDGLSLYGETSFPLGELTGLLGLRYERWDVERGDDYSELNPKVSLSYEDPSGRLWYLSAGRAFVMPSFFQIYMPMRSWGIPNYQLRPEKGWSYEAGVRSAAGWSFNLFYTDLDDRIAYQSDPITWIGQYVNLERYRAYGVEAEWVLRLSEGLTYRQGLSWAYGEERASGQWTRSGDPRWKSVSTLEWTRGPWRASVTGRFYGDRAIRDNTNHYSEEDIFLVDLNLSRSLGEMELTLGGRNVFGREFFVDRSGYVTPERTWYLTLSGRI